MTLVLSQLNFRHTAKKDYVAQLEHRIEVLEKELAKSEAKNEALATEITIMLRQMAGVRVDPTAAR